MDIQKRLFEEIETIYRGQFNLTKVVAEVLGIEVDSVYRRKRCETPLSLQEAAKLCKHFKISMDSILGIKSEVALFKHISLDIEDFQNYYKYVNGFSSGLQALSSAKEKEIFFSADDIPIFHFMPFTELTLFKVYTWYSTVCKISITFEQFIRGLDVDYLKSTYNQLFGAYRHIPSKEIWTKSTIKSILNLLDYYNDIEQFETKETPILLCKQLLELLDNVALWAKQGNKDIENKESDFQIYVSPVNPENSLMLSRLNSQLTTQIKMFTINSISTTDKKICLETEAWILNTISKSINISGGSERERFKFFQSLRKSVIKLLSKFETSTNE